MPHSVQISHCSEDVRSLFHFDCGQSVQAVAVWGGKLKQNQLFKPDVTLRCPITANQIGCSTVLLFRPFTHSF